jgi:hypothetical protein
LKYRRPTAGSIAACQAESVISGAGRSSATVAVGQPVVANARHGGDQSIDIPLARGTAGELGGSRQRSSDHEGIRSSSGEHRERTTIRLREVGAGNGKRSRVGADGSSGRPPTESKSLGDRGDKPTTRIPSSGQIDRQTNHAPVSVPRFARRRPKTKTKRDTAKPPEVASTACRHHSRRPLTFNGTSVLSALSAPTADDQRKGVTVLQIVVDEHPPASRHPIGGGLSASEWPGARDCLWEDRLPARRPL